MSKTFAQFYQDFGDELLFADGPTKLALAEVKFQNETLEDLDLSDWLFCDVEFINVQFHETNFLYNYFYTCSFTNCQFSDCDFQKSEFSDCKFINSEFNNSEMVKVIFRQSHFSESKFTQNNLNAALFNECNFKNISYDLISQFENSIVSNCDILKKEQSIKVQNSIDFQKFLESS